MNFDLTDEQELLRDTAREVFSRTYDIETRNKTVDSELGWSRDVWRQLAEIGILGLGFEPEESGQIEIMVVMTELGRRLAPEPVATAALIPGGLIAELGSAEQRAILDDVAGGEKLLALAHAEKGLRGLDELSTRATKDGDGWTITGRKNPVLAGGSADVLVVTAGLPDGGVGAFLVDAAATTRRAYRTFDGHRGAEIDFTDAPAQPLGDGGDASERIHATLIRWSSSLCAEAVGAMDESLRLTTEYLNARKQFGVPLKTFQTLTQRAADMYVSLELARSMNYYAAMSITDGRLDPVVAARSKLQIGRSGKHIAQESIQMHGGIGVTAEYPVAHYAARLTAIDQTLGSATDQLRFLSKQVGEYGVVSL
ncbi:alkylation response protein AidB-like acyl-CoA dehydrogenase [Mycolicibacterium sp. BK556]|uniref:acyl-CoA dehydrogenase family protein n=1 Tax=unclassified Mycolicibacterium TaxID=2636767 RepID=UPI00160A0BCE|nr:MULTISPECIES: acyl-CoA dehydrogenase [unclassified Mycolicibacterium]MBB3603558.1 alkylation response protein AidB-like acyl-CoA dehydrogenase [Mycolicibacterium sp. BK556]MBB3633753.1 alkylation response protein AidB-like acyl-CoA dehydrogenase [Mycolicibacterium sp. BK607]